MHKSRYEYRNDIFQHFRLMKTHVKMMGLKVSAHHQLCQITHLFELTFILADFPSDHSLGLDVVEANRQFMVDSEELYDALIVCHWPAFEFPDSPENPPEYSSYE